MITAKDLNEITKHHKEIYLKQQIDNILEQCVTAAKEGNNFVVLTFTEYKDKSLNKFYTMEEILTEMSKRDPDLKWVLYGTSEHHSILNCNRNSYEISW